MRRPAYGNLLLMQHAGSAASRVSYPLLDLYKGGIVIG